jgi:hypothetical protein
MIYELIERLNQDLFERSFGGKYESIRERMACAFLIPTFAGKSNIKVKAHHDIRLDIL